MFYVHITLFILLSIIYLVLIPSSLLWLFFQKKSRKVGYVGLIIWLVSILIVVLIVNIYNIPFLMRILIAFLSVLVVIGVFREKK